MTTSKEQINQHFNLECKLNFVDIFLFVNNKWMMKLIQLFLIVTLYSLGDYLLKFLDGKVNIKFLQTFLLNLALLLGFYLFFLVTQCAYSISLDHWSKGLKIDHQKIEFEMKNSKLILDNWDFVTKAKIGWNKYFYLYYNRSQAHIIPFRAFEDQEEIQKFREILKSKNKLS